MSTLVQIRMLTRGPNKNHRAKAVVLVDAARAQLLVAGKHAEPVAARDRVKEGRDADH